MKNVVLFAFFALTIISVTHFSGVDQAEALSYKQLENKSAFPAAEKTPIEIPRRTGW